MLSLQTSYISKNQTVMVTSLLWHYPRFMYRCQINRFFYFSILLHFILLVFKQKKVIFWIRCLTHCLVILCLCVLWCETLSGESPWGRLLSAPGVCWSEVEGGRCRPTFPVYHDCHTSLHPDGTPAPGSLTHCTPGHGTKSWWRLYNISGPSLD